VARDEAAELAPRISTGPEDSYWNSMHS
jgi:hypothetical protein